MFLNHPQQLCCTKKNEKESQNYYCEELNYKLAYYFHLLPRKIFCYSRHTKFYTVLWNLSDTIKAWHGIMEQIWPGLDINVCPIPVETDVGQVDLVLRLSYGTCEKIRDSQTCRYDGQIYFHWYNILGLLYKRAVFDLQFVHNLFWLKLEWNARSKLFYWYHLSFIHALMKFKDIDKIKVAISETL